VELYDLHSSPNIIRVMIARRMMSGACGTCGGNVRAGILWENLRDRDYLEDIDKHGRVILKWI